MAPKYRRKRGGNPYRLSQVVRRESGLPAQAEGPWYAERAQNNVPIFAIEPQQLKDQPAATALTNAEGEQEDHAAAVCQRCVDDPPAMFCEDCMEL